MAHSNRRDKKPDNEEIEFDLMMQLGDYVERGIPLFFENKPSTPYEVANNLTVRENEVYMADYVRDDLGNPMQIRYDKVV